MADTPDGAPKPKYTFSNGYQELILSGILRDPTFLKQYREAIDPTFFSQSSHQKISNLVLQFFDKYGDKPGRDVLVEALVQQAQLAEWETEDVDEVTIEIDRLVDLESSTAEIESIKDNASRFAQNQAMKTSVMDAIKVVQNNEKDPDDEKYSLDQLVPLFQKALMVGQTTNIGVSVTDNIADVHKIAELDPISNPRFRVPTGIPRLDGYLNGGLGAAELGFIIAESNKGKSMALLNLAVEAVRRDKRVIYFTLELKPYEVSLRFWAKMYGVSIDQVRDNDPVYIRSRDNMIKAWAKGREMKLSRPREFQVVYFPPSNATIVSLRAAIERIHAKKGWKPDLIILDYIDEMRLGAGTKRRPTDEDTYHTFGMISTELIDMGASYQCPVWSASQIQRAAYMTKTEQTKEPELSNVGRSMQKVDKAEVILAIVQTDTERDNKKMRYRILKNRRGSKGGSDPYISCRFDPAKADIHEIKDEFATRDNPDPGASEEATA